MNIHATEPEASGHFPATRWSLVLAAQQSDEARARRAGFDNNL
jgi:hypothetical protein